jgi:hypothetical protein
VGAEEGGPGAELATIMQAVTEVPAGFMLDGNTYRRGSELGLDAIDFYVAGRAGVLGDVPGLVAAAAMVFLAPDHVVAAWDRARAVVPIPTCADAFASCLASWADGHLPDGVDYARLADVLEAVLAAATPAGAPLFAGWRALPEPSAPGARALHRLNALRELQGAWHGAAVLAAGLEPEEALAVRSPQMAQLFGWSEPLPDPEPCRARWEQAQRATERRMAQLLGRLPGEDLGWLAATVSALRLG